MQISTQLLVDNSIGLRNPTYASGRLPTMMNGQLYLPKTSYQDTLAPYTSITALPNTTPCERAKERKSKSHRPTKTDRPMPAPTNSVLTNDPPWKQGRHTHASLPMHDADDNTIATSTNISPTLPIPRKPPDPVPIPRANARHSCNTRKMHSMTERTMPQAAEQTPQAVQHMTDTTGHCTTLDDKRGFSLSLDRPFGIPKATIGLPYPQMIPCQMTVSRCSNSAPQESPRPATRNPSRRLSMQGVDGDTLEQDDSKPSRERNEHAARPDHFSDDKQ